MPGSIDTHRLDLLLLCRLCTQGKSKLSRSELDRQLFPFVEHALSRPAWRDLLGERLDALREAGLLEGTTPTDAGRRRVSEELGTEQLPPWKTLKSVILPLLSLGLSDGKKARDRLRDAGGLRASVLRGAHELPTRELPTLTQAIDALVWRALGVETDRPVTAAAIRAHFLAEEAGGTSRLSADKLAALLAARAAGAPTPDARVVRLALAQRWLGGEEPPAAEEEPAAPAGREAEAAEPPSLQARAERIRAAARGVRDGRFGDRKVFISAAWRALEGDPLFRHVDLEKFKEILTSAHISGLLTLHRADLVGVMDEEEVRASETRYLNATFHFIESDPGDGEGLDRRTA